MRLLALVVLIVLGINGLVSAQVRDTVKLLMPFPDQILTEDQPVDFDYRPYLELKLHGGVIRYEILHDWVRDPGFILFLDTLSKRLRITSFDPFWGEAKVRLFHLTGSDGDDSTLIDAFAVQWTQVKDDPVLFTPFQGILKEDVPISLDLDAHFFDFDDLRPYRYVILKADGGVEASLQGRSLTLRPKPEFNGAAQVTVRVANTLDSQRTEIITLNIEAVNDPPRLIKPLRDTAVPYFEGLDIDPLAHFVDMDDSLHPSHRHALSVEMDPVFLAGGAQPPPRYHVHSVGPLGSAWIKLNAIDPELGPFTTEAKVLNNAPWPTDRHMLLPTPGVPTFEAYAARPDLAWVDARRGILRVPTVTGSILFDPRRRLLTPPFGNSPGACIVADPAGWSEYGEPVPGALWFIGKMDWPQGATGKGDAGSVQDWSYRTVEGHASWSPDAKFCVVDRPAAGKAWRLLRWDAGLAGISSFKSGVADPESHLVLPDTSRILDALLFGDRILLLRKVTHSTGNERDIVWLDAYDASDPEQTFAKSPVSTRISKYDPNQGNTALISRIYSGRLWVSGNGVEVFWGKVDKVKADDIYGVTAGSRLYRTVLDSSLFPKASHIRINQATAGASADIRLVAIDVIAPDNANLYWVNNDGSCFDVRLSITRVDPTDPLKVFPEIVSPVRDCGSVGEFPFTIDQHFGGGRSTLTYGRNSLNRKYLQFTGAFPTALHGPSRPPDRTSRKAGISRGVVRLGGKVFNVLGRRPIP